MMLFAILLNHFPPQLNIKMSPLPLTLRQNILLRSKRSHRPVRVTADRLSMVLNSEEGLKTLAWPTSGMAMTGDSEIDFATPGTGLQ